MPSKRKAPSAKTQVRVRSITDTKMLVALVALAISGGLAFAALPAKPSLSPLGKNQCGIQQVKLLNETGKTYQAVEIVCDGQSSKKPFVFDNSKKRLSVDKLYETATLHCQKTCEVKPQPRQRTERRTERNQQQQQQEEPQPACVDNDGGVNITVASTVDWIGNDEPAVDNCISDTMVNEAVCNQHGSPDRQRRRCEFTIDNDANGVGINYTSACVQGACIEPIVLDTCGTPENGWQENGVYVLTHDIAFAPDVPENRVPTCFAIDTTNVTLDCRGFSVIVEDGPILFDEYRRNGTGVLIEGENITVENCTFENFSQAIRLLGDNNTLEDNTFNYNATAIQWSNGSHRVVNNTSCINNNASIACGTHPGSISGRGNTFATVASQCDGNSWPRERAHYTSCTHPKETGEPCDPAPWRDNCDDNRPATEDWCDAETRTCQHRDLQ